MSFFLHLKSRETVLFSWQHTASPARARLIPPPSIYPRLFSLCHLPCKQAVSNSIFLTNIFSQSITLFFHFREDSEYESKWSTDMPSSDALKLSWTPNAIHIYMAFCLHNSISIRYESQWYLLFFLYVENAVCLHLIYTATDKLVFPCSYF